LRALWGGFHDGISFYGGGAKREAHLGAPRAAAVTGRWLAMVTRLLQASATTGGGSKGWIELEPAQTSATGRPQARRGVAVGQKSVKWRRGERWGELGFDHLRTKC
jgi:hypothetical protein